MSSVRRRGALQAFVLLATLAGALLLGCGDSSSSDNTLSEVDFSKTTLASCLQANGATFATSTDDLSFFSEAESDGTAAHFGFTSDKSAQLVIDLFGDTEDPRSWLMWTAHPPGEQPSPEDIADNAPSGGYVAFIENPSASERKSLEACTD